MKGLAFLSSLLIAGASAFAPAGTSSQKSISHSVLVPEIPTAIMTLYGSRYPSKKKGACGLVWLGQKDA